MLSLSGKKKKKSKKFRNFLLVRVGDEGLEKLGFGKEVDCDCLRASPRVSYNFFFSNLGENVYFFAPTVFL